MEVISRKDALALGLKKYYTGKPCKRGHMSYRYTGCAKCITCVLDKMAEYHLKNKEKKCEYQRQYNSLNREKRNEYANRYRKANIDKFREYFREYAKTNRSVYNVNAAKRRSAERNATPSWLTAEDYKNIKAVYDMSSRLSDCLKIKHHVDHIVPLKGQTVCGLHVPWNLSAIPAKMNYAKNNKLLLEEPS